LSNNGSRLPEDATRFFGRSTEFTAIRDAVGHGRLVTLTGPGGVGKSRLALEVARVVGSAFPDGVFLVSLSGVRDGRLLASTVAGALDLPERATPATVESLLPRLHGRRMLLILDTCEHLLDACADFANRLQREAAGPRLLATSRQALDVAGEVVYPIAPLPVPDDGGDAVALFADRVRASMPGFEVTEANRAQVVMLCRGLDGIPLAIELAAVRTRAVGLTEMLTRLSDRLRLLAGPGHPGPSRHQTLRATIAWSYELCSDAERLLWARLSVFAGEFGLEAAEQVCAGDGLAADSLVEALVGLVDKSILAHVDSQAGARYQMLDTIREFGAELLTGPWKYQRRHRDYYRSLAGAFAEEFIGPSQASWIRRMSADHANLVLALERFLDDGERDDSERDADDDGAGAGAARAGLEMATSLWGFWAATGQLGAGRYWLERMMDAWGGESPGRATRAWLASIFLDGLLASDDIVALLHRIRSVAAAGGDEVTFAWAGVFLALASAFCGNPGAGAAAFRDAIDQFTRKGDPRGVSMAVLCAAMVHLLSGELGEVIADCGRVLRLLPEGECWLHSWAWWQRGLASWQAGDMRGAAECYREGLRARLELGVESRLGLAPLMDAAAWLAAAEGDHSRAARLQGAADRMWRSAVGVPRFAVPLLGREYQTAVERSTAALGQTAYERMYSMGAALDAAEAVRLALAASSPFAPATAAAGAASPERDQGAPGTAQAGHAAPASPWDVLTPREREVAALVAQGLTNRSIATRLVVSKRTIDAHVEHILAKLGFSSRVQVAALASPARSAQEGSAQEGSQRDRPAALAPRLMPPEDGAGDA
jgi:predicted ATPase/DNA-binding NarL/FixJ family response regulator